MAIVIRLDVPALERLIGGDSEVEVELRKGVVAEFARRHLTAVLKDESFQKFLRDEATLIHTGLDAIVHEKIGTIERKSDGWKTWDSINMRPAFREKIESAADFQIGQRIQEAVEKAWKVREPVLTQTIAYKIDALTDDFIRRLTKERMEKIAKEMAK